nr:MAG: putative transposase [Candidatus Kentron sp. FM]
MWLILDAVRPKGLTSILPSILQHPTPPLFAWKKPMAQYRRIKIQGATYFFTVNCAERQGNRLLTDNIHLLRQAFHKVKKARPFRIVAIVVLPEHIHCLWRMPPWDADYKTRWSLIKAGFSRAVSPGEQQSESRLKRGERGIWQRRYWEHMIRDDLDLERHVNYIHWNPVKHGWAERVSDWPYSSFHRYVQNGIYPSDWSDEPKITIDTGE